MNFKSFAPFEYKNRLINTLLDRIYKINSSWNGFDLDVKSLKSSLARNLYPTRLIDRCIRIFLNKIFVSGERDDINKKDLQTRYVILPYIGDYSKVAKNKIKKLIKAFCKDNISINLVFTTCKVKNYCSTKDRIPSCFKSNVVYHFNCTRCNSCYVGRTHIHYNERRKQHLGTDRNSSILKHLNKNKECKDYVIMSHLRFWIMPKMIMN